MEDEEGIQGKAREIADDKAYAARMKKFFDCTHEQSTYHHIFGTLVCHQCGAEADVVWDI
tara:strand:- start:25076 stop:25255 length:180 start_codon:yes stop_codon:yes gene_type:complete